ncbi:MAG: hypothetical protein ACOCP1_00195 [Campylobacterales bacterium]
MEVHGYKKDEIYILELDGIIKSFDEISEFKSALSSGLEDAQSVEIHIKNSDTISSALIGLMIKSIFTSKKPISVVVYSKKLLETMNRLNLMDTLKIRRG